MTSSVFRCRPRAGAVAGGGAGASAGVNSSGSGSSNTSCSSSADSVSTSDAGEESDGRSEATTSSMCTTSTSVSMARRGRGESASEPKLNVGTRVDGSSHELVYIMILGIRTVVSRAATVVVRNGGVVEEPTAASSKLVHRWNFLHDGTERTPAHKHSDFKFQDYAPVTFRAIRSLFLDEDVYLMSLTDDYVLTELSSPGKSGAYLYFSNDLRFVIKTITLTEAKLLRSILYEYYLYLKENPNTLLSKFYGLHRVKPHKGKKTYFVIMENVFPPDLDIHRKYDLKGSTWGRTVGAAKVDKESSTLKDLDFLSRKASLLLGPHKRAAFLDQVRRDVEYLTSIGVMDYSLLVGVHDLNISNSQFLRATNLSVVKPIAPELASRDDIVNANLRKKYRRQAKQALVKRPVALTPLAQAGEPTTHLVASSIKVSLFAADQGGFASTGTENEPLNEVYFLGIIDFLQKYNAKKKLENRYKSLRFDKDTISAVPPDQYARRFFEFIEANTGVPDDYFAHSTDVHFPAGFTIDEATDSVVRLDAAGKVIARGNFPLYLSPFDTNRLYGKGATGDDDAFDPNHPTHLALSLATVTDTATDGEYLGAGMASMAVSGTGGPADDFITIDDTHDADADDDGSSKPRTSSANKRSDDATSCGPVTDTRDGGSTSEGVSSAALDPSADGHTAATDDDDDDDDDDISITTTSSSYYTSTSDDD
ncbi:serine/threonine protein kinase [Thecamonas trahens ATCC 50062]|uniref:Serine/threonine protein kinase n=1 Tax=Thecamonas trahens ATCC 50062 TaxID=461836 RepID=A0A0L0D705_THETB|nr:serine/threonine protein kinase [Thecamonas trahens ATCC 50062]KNC47995.1 serine/threonine protein kinase [Thecamonas trahens ATCC 50062]|eukprot:XP_013759012.1 serine/threonine protein kinase [Thecamonas trahens ATCC 50062]